jgi:hypothetical protein
LPRGTGWPATSPEKRFARAGAHGGEKTRTPARRGRISPRAQHACGPNATLDTQGSRSHTRSAPSRDALAATCGFASRWHRDCVTACSSPEAAAGERTVRATTQRCCAPCPPRAWRSAG